MSVSILDAWIEGTAARTVSAGTDRLLLLLACDEVSNSITNIITSALLGAANFTFHSRYVVGTGSFRVMHEIWYMKDAAIPAGSNAVTLNWVAPTHGSNGIVALQNVDQTTPIADADNTNAEPYLSESITLTVKAGSFSAAICSPSSTGRTFTWNNATEKLLLTTASFSSSIADQAEATDGTNTITATASSSATRGLISGCNIEPSGAPPPPATKIIYPCCAQLIS